MWMWIRPVNNSRHAHPTFPGKIKVRKRPCTVWESHLQGSWWHPDFHNKERGKILMSAGTKQRHLWIRASKIWVGKITQVRDYNTTEQHFQQVCRYTYIPTAIPLLLFFCLHGQSVNYLSASNYCVHFPCIPEPLLWLCLFIIHFKVQAAEEVSEVLLQTPSGTPLSIVIKYTNAILCTACISII